MRDTYCLKITGIHINYYYVCPRKLWLFSHGINMEHTSDMVYTGKIVDDNAYQREEKHLDIDGVINIDWIDTKRGIIHEVKKSDAVEKAHEMQMVYYLWYLKQKGSEIENSDQQPNTSDFQLKGEIDYPLLKQRTEVVLTEEKEKELITAMLEIEKIMTQDKPPARINKKFCRKCSYFELCYA